VKTKFYTNSFNIKNMRVLGVVALIAGVAFSFFGVPVWPVFIVAGLMHVSVSIWMEKKPIIVFNDDHIFTKFAIAASVRLIRYTDIESFAKPKENKWSIVVKNGKPLTIHTKAFEPEDLDIIEALINEKLAAS